MTSLQLAWVALAFLKFAWFTPVDALATCRASDLACILTDPAQSWSSNTTLSFPGSPEFEDATERWTVFRPPTYKATVRPGTEDDIIRVIKVATAWNIPFLARGAGHSYTTTIGNLKNGLNIDLSEYKSIQIDKKAQTVTIGPGVTAADIFDPLFNAGFEIQTGTCSCPSLIGITLGGGIGRQLGVYGLMIDAVTSMTVITAAGQKLKVSRTSNPDLFWAMRGAGANFGIVTSATYKVRPLANNGSIFRVEWTIPASSTAAYFKFIETLSGKMPAKLATISIMLYDTEISQGYVLATWTYFGPESEARSLLKPVYNIAEPYAQGFVPWNQLVATVGNGVDQAVICVPDMIRDLYNSNLRNYSAATLSTIFTKMQEFWAAHPGGRGSAVSLEFFPNQAMSAVPLSDSAYPWRDSTGYIVPTFNWEAGDEATAAAANVLGNELRAAVTATSGYCKHTVFANYARGDEPLERVYGPDNLPRLVTLKKKWDPKNVFRYHNGLPTSL